MNAIPDIQSSKDLRNLPINQVGIKALRMPVAIQSKEGSQHTVGLFAMTVRLPAEQKGTHMSRFVALLEDNQQPLNFDSFSELTHDMLTKLDSNAGKIEVSMPFFRQKTAPVSGIKSLLDYDVTMIGEVKDGRYSHRLKVLIPVTSLCPCSKQISQYGAHNQRSHVTLDITTSANVAIEDLIDMVEAQASCQLYGLLKRPDEKFVTERAYENPKFVEDMVRDIAAELRKIATVSAFVVESENFESIHNHSAYAYIQYP